MTGCQRRKNLLGRLLKHIIKGLRRFAAGKKNPVMRRQRRIHPETIANDISLGNRGVLQGFCCPDIDITTDHQGMERFRSHIHNLFVERELKAQQILGEPLPPSPAEDGHRRQDFSRRSVSRKTTPQTSGMDEDTLCSRKPIRQRT